MKIQLFILIIAVANATRACMSMKYGKYCGNDHTSYYGEHPADILDAICHIHDVCTTSSRLDVWCNCQMLYYSLPIITQNDAAESMRQCMMYYGALSCVNILSNYSNGFDILRKIPRISKYSAGFNYFTLFDNFTANIAAHNGTLDGLYIAKFYNYGDYLVWTHKIFADPLAILARFDTKKLTVGKYFAPILMIINTNLASNITFDFIRLR